MADKKKKPPQKGPSPKETKTYEAEKKKPAPKKPTPKK